MPNRKIHRVGNEAPRLRHPMKRPRPRQIRPRPHRDLRLQHHLPEPPSTHPHPRSSPLRRCPDTPTPRSPPPNTDADTRACGTSSAKQPASPPDYTAPHPPGTPDPKTPGSSASPTPRSRAPAHIARYDAVPAPLFPVQVTVTSYVWSRGASIDIRYATHGPRPPSPPPSPPRSGSDAHGKPAPRPRCSPRTPSRSQAPQSASPHPAR